MNLLLNYGMVILPATWLVVQARTQLEIDDPWQLVRELITFAVSILLAWAVKYVRESRAEVQSTKKNLPAPDEFAKLKTDVALLTDALERVREERDEAEKLLKTTTEALERANYLLKEERSTNINLVKAYEMNEKKIIELQQQNNLLNLVNARVEELAIQMFDRIAKVLQISEKLEGD